MRDHLDLHVDLAIGKAFDVDSTQINTQVAGDLLCQSLEGNGRTSHLVVGKRAGMQERIDRMKTESLPVVPSLEP